MLAAPLHRRSAWRLAHVVVDILLAHGRRTVASWWRATGIEEHYGVYYYFLTSVGRKATAVAAVVFGLLRDRIDPGGRLLLAIDDMLTKRYGPRVQGAGVHHNPTPGLASSKFLYSHSWVVLNRIVRHERCGAIGLPLLGRLYIKDLPKLPDPIDWPFRTKPQLAADLITWAGSLAASSAQRSWTVVDGSYANREFLKPAKKAGVSWPGCGGMPSCTTSLRRSNPVRTGAGSPADLRQEPPQPSQAGWTATGLAADDRRGDDDGTGSLQGGQELLGDVTPGRGADLGGDRA